ncbi:MAG: cytochrome c [Deltaproteobacteria bacterium]|nr:cytochrome c [Deltaproteobacteria bacterium]
MSLSDEMKGHGDAMTDLVWAVLYLEHDQVGRVAAEIAEPGLGRARAEDDPLRTAFPETYFELERELLARSRELADTAATKDAAAIALAYGRVAETCVRCHAVYLDDRPAP